MFTASARNFAFKESATLSRNQKTKNKLGDNLNKQW